MKTVKQLVSAAVAMTLVIGLQAQNITFNETELYPEGLTYSKKLKSFLVSSLTQGTVGKVDWDGNYTKFIDDEDIVSSIGIKADDKNDILYVCISDPGVSVKTDKRTQGKLAKVAAYTLSTGKRKFIVDLGVINADKNNFANDLTIDKDGNLYVTNSFDNVIFKVNKSGEASIYARSDMWTGDGFSLNGITYLKSGLLIVDKMNDGGLFTVDLNNDGKVTKIDAPAVVGADGIVLINSKELWVISNGQQKAFRLKSEDNWASAKIVSTVDTEASFPSTGVKVKKDSYILNAKLNEVFDPETPNSSDFIIQKLGQ